MYLYGLLISFSSILFHSSLLYCGHHLLQLKFNLSNSQESSKKLWSSSNWLVSILQAVLATLVGVGAVLSTNNDILDTRIPFLKPYAWFNLGYWIYDLVCLFVLVTRDEGEQGKGLVANIVRFVQWWPGIVFHHVAIIVFLTMGILYTSRVRGDGIVGFALIMELSSIFVAFRSLLGTLDMKGTRLYLVVSIIMVVTFFFSRIFLIPYMIHVYCEQTSQSLVAGLLSLPPACKLGTTSFYCLNMYWFYLMLKGCVKAVRNGGLKED